VGEPAAIIDNSGASRSGVLAEPGLAGASCGSWANGKLWAPAPADGQLSRSAVAGRMLGSALGPGSWGPVLGDPVFGGPIQRDL